MEPIYLYIRGCTCTAVKAAFVRGVKLHSVALANIEFVVILSDTGRKAIALQ